MKPTEELVEEHRAIKKMLDIMGVISQKLENGESVATSDLDAIIDFIHLFTDKCHHGKEEDILFPALVAAGVAKEGGLIEVLLFEHEQGRQYINQIAGDIELYKTGNNKVASEVSKLITQYTNMLIEHIHKEDTDLYPMSDYRLSQEKQQQLLSEFERLEQEVIGPGKHEALHEQLHQFQEKYIGG